MTPKRGVSGAMALGRGVYPFCMASCKLVRGASHTVEWGAP